MRGRRNACALLVPVALAVAASPMSSASAAVLPPTADTFYRYTGATPLAQIAPGTVLKTRSTTMHIVGTSVPVPADQLLYRTAGEKGEPTVTVTTVLKPPTAPVLNKVISYQSFYDALGAQCDPSFWLGGGDAGSVNAQNVDIEEGIIAELLALGYFVNVPDFEGEQLHWVAGHESGYDTLDSVRAAEADLNLPATTPVGLMGYSGGSIGSEWASELAPGYAPELNIVGVAEGGIPVDLAHNLPYINGSKSWSGIMPAVILSLARAEGIDLAPYLSAYGSQLMHEAEGQCINSLLGRYPGLTIQKMLKPQWQDPFSIRPLVQVINDLTMGTVAGHPAAPLLMFVGNADGTGDDVMVAADVQALAHEYCSEGVHVTLAVEPKLEHIPAAVPWDAAAIPFLEDRLNGLPFVDGCASVPVGNSLAPLPLPKAAPAKAGTIVTLRIINGRGGHHGTVRAPADGHVTVRVHLRLAKGEHSAAELAGRRIKVGGVTLVTGKGGSATGHLRLGGGGSPHPLRAVFAGNASLARSASDVVTVVVACPSGARACAA